MSDDTELAALLSKVTQLTGDGDKTLLGLSRATRRNRRMIWFIAGLSAVTILLTFLVTGALVIARDNTERLQQVTDRLNISQTVQRQKALCPLYSILLVADTPAARAQAPDKTLYDREFAVIREGYSALECSDFTGGAPSLGK